MSLNQSFWKKSVQKFLALLFGFLLFFTFSSSAAFAQATTTTPTKPAAPASSNSSAVTNTTGNAPKPDDICGDALFGGGCLKGTTDYASGDSKTIVSNLTVNIINILIYIGAAVAVFFIVLGGYKIITSNGEEKTAKEGRDMLGNALIGVVVLVVSYTLVTVVSNFVTTINIGGSAT
jgi:NADH:ubiquinone oxidoreductase subunit 6 (subunit J)